MEARSSGELLSLFSVKCLDLALIVSAQPLEQGERLGAIQPLWVAAAHFKHPLQAPLPIAVQLSGCPYRAAAIRALKERGIYYRVLLESASSPAVEACIRSGMAVGLVEESRIGKGLIREIAGVELPPLPMHHLYLLGDSSRPGFASV